MSIAVALVNNPKVLFFDEPTTGLDPQARRNLWELIKSFQEEGKTVVLTTHYMEEAEELCDRVAIIDEGKIIKINSPSNLIDELTKSGFKSSKKPKMAGRGIEADGILPFSQTVSFALFQPTHPLAFTSK